MQNKKLLITIVGFLLLASTFAVIPAYSAQPPINLTSYYIGTIGQPRRVDPTRAYDTASGELIMNVYEPLIFFSDKPVPAIPGNYSINMLNEAAADLSLFNNVLCTGYTISPDGETWTFTIDETIPWQPWQAANGTWYYQFVTAADVEYSFKRMLVQDQIGSPGWMICLPLCGSMWFGGFGYTFPADEALVAGIINTAITRVGNTVSFHMIPGKPWPQTAFMQILAQTWGCICNRDWCIEHGCWDTSFAAGWSANYRQKPSNSYTPLDSYYAAKSLYPSASSVPAMCGTGPYIFNYWSKSALEYQVYAWENLVLPGIPPSHVTYRGGWNAGGNIKSLRTITVKGIAEWSTRKMMFLAGDSDVVAVPRANMYDLLSGDAYTPLPGILLYYNSPAFSNDVASFVLEVAADTPYMPKINGVNTPDFFGDDNVRRAFCQTLNFTQYLADAWWGEAIQPCTWWVEGLAPDYKNYTLEAEKWNINMAAFRTELENSDFGDLWDIGFETYLVYNLGNDQRKIAAEMMRDAIQSQNTLRPGKDPFVVNVVGIDWPVFLDYEEEFYMPMFFVGWLADFADADNFARPYMHSGGDFAYYQHYGNTTIDALIDTGIITPDGPARQAIYEELQYIYHMDSPGLPLIQAVGRGWYRDWMRGWYLNQLYPGGYWYDRYKTVMPAPTLVDLDATHTVMNVTEYLSTPPSRNFNGTIEICYPYGTALNPVGGFNITFNVSRNDAIALSVPAVMTVLYNNSVGYSIALDAIYVTIPAAPGVILEEYLLNLPSLTIGMYTVYGTVYVFANNFADSDLTNNIDQGGWFNATWLLGDVDNSRKVELMDFYYASNAYGSYPGKTNWDARCDIWKIGTGPVTSPVFNGDSKVELMDFYCLSTQYFKTLPK